MSKVKFGDIVKDVKINVDRGNNPYEFYVAGDHMDSEDLNIRRRGRFATDDVGPAFTRIFKPGQVLYGSRRTYLKKVAVADFEGICANTTFVFETKDSMVFEQRLLPFLMLSEGFTNWSISHSKGSTNPYVLFSDLASYEFDLPSIDEQKVLAEKLWAAYEVKQSYLKMIDATQEMVKAQFIEMFGEPFTSNYPQKKLSEVSIFKSGTTYPVFDEKENGDIPYSKVADMNLEGNEVYMNFSSKYLDKSVVGNSILPIGTVIFPKRGAAIATNKKRILNRNMCVDLNIMGVIPSEAIDPIYLYSYFYCIDLVNIMDNSGIPQINNKHLTSLSIGVPPLDKQKDFVSIFQQSDKSISELRKSIDAIDKVIKSLINENL